MTSLSLDQLLAAFEVEVDALAVCEVHNGLSLIAQPQNAIIVHYVLSGTMHVAVSDGSAAICPQGSVVVVSPGLGQTISADGESAQPVLAADLARPTRAGMFLVDAASGEVGDLRFACGAVSTNLPCLSALLEEGRGLIAEDLSDLALVRHAFELMLAEIADFDLGARALSGALMKSCLVLMVRRRLDRPAARSFSALSLRPGLQKALNQVLDQPAAPHSVASLAVCSGMSRSSFAKAFADAFRMTPMAFVANTRLQHAMTLLRSTHAPVKSIAAAVGFSSRSHFSRLFRQTYGADPSQFRKTQSSRLAGNTTFTNEIKLPEGLDV